MAGNTPIITNLVDAVRDYIAAVSGIGFASTVITQDDYRMADEERDGLLGLHIATPAVIVSCAQAPFDLTENPCIQAEVSVLVRHSIEQDTLATHQTETGIVFNALWDQAALGTYIDNVSTLVLSDAQFGGLSFQRNGRAYESTITLSITVASVAT